MKIEVGKTYKSLSSKNGYKKGDTFTVIAVHNLTKEADVRLWTGLEIGENLSDLSSMDIEETEYIHPVTDEVSLEFKMKKIISKIDEVNWNTVSFGNLTKIAEILDIKV